MNRLCIYVTYNKENKIEAYMGYMLKALREHATVLYVVCNYPKILDGAEYIEPYADGIFYRENNGYDAGAYKDMLCTIIGWNTICQYDELILVNDSFFGPFYNLGNYFDLMGNAVCDFWGMTGSLPGKIKVGEHTYRYGSHIQSFFLVFRKQILISRQFRNFWEELSYPATLAEAILGFEIGINEYLVKNGFISQAVTDVLGMVFKENENPYFLYSYEMIAEKKLPILKKRSLTLTNPGFANALKAVGFLRDCNLYPVSWILNLISDQFYIENYAPCGTNCLEFFYEKYSKIYIYGAGACGKNIIAYFEHKGWTYEGILVTNKFEQDIECTEFGEAQIDSDTGIIISVINKEASEEVIQYIGEKCKREQLFKICDCAMI